MKLTPREKQIYKWLVEFYEKDGAVINQGHKLDHILRVLYWAAKLQKAEKGDLRILIPAVLLHDIGQAYDKSENQSMHALVSAQKAPEVLKKFGYTELEIEKICETIELHSSRFASPKNMTQEGKIIYDSDKMDACDLTILVRAARMNNEMSDKQIAELILSWVNKWRSKTGSNIFYTEEGRRIGTSRIKRAEKYCQKIIKEENKIDNFFKNIKIYG